ncbi:MAG TPA: DUF692 family protein [Kofleriaceae bacterium]|jgi:hypothetical protein
MITLSAGSLADFGQSAEALRAADLRPDAIEILWDNFCALDPVRLADDLAALAGRVMLHVMWSRYLELDEPAFAGYLARLRRHVDVLRPLAVSDHLCRFQLGGAFVGAAQERDYDDLDVTCERVARYHDAIGQQLLIENTASSEHPAAMQIEFVGELQARTGCGILFDISNAVVGELNGRGGVAEWLPLIAGKPVRCHVGSYSHDAEGECYVDSHDADVSAATEAAIRLVASSAKIASITYERDANRSAAAIAADLRRIGASL